MAKRSSKYQPGTLPTREAILEAVSQFPDIDSKREIARHFGIKGDDRIALKVMLRDMENEGLLARKRKAIRVASELPAVTVLDIPADADPENLHAFPARWDEEEGEKPRVTVLAGKDARVVPAPGDRILARIQRGDGLCPHLYAGHMKVLDKPARPISASCGWTETAAAGCLSSGRAKRALPQAIGGCRGWRSCRSRDAFGPPDDPPARSSPSSAIQIRRCRGLIALHALDIPIASRHRHRRSCRGAGGTLKGRETGTISCSSLSTPRCQGPRRRGSCRTRQHPANPGGHHPCGDRGRAIVRPGSAMTAKLFARYSVYFPDRGADAARKFQRFVLAAQARTGPRWPAHRHRRRGTETPFLPSRDDAVTGSYQQAQAAIDGSRTSDRPLLETILAIMGTYAALEARPPGPRRSTCPSGDQARWHGRRCFVPERLEAPS